MRSDLTEQRTVTNHDYGLTMRLYWSPNGQYIAYEFLVLGEDGGLEIRVFDVVADEMTILTPNRVEGVAGLSWSPDSRYLAFGNGIDPETNSSIQRIDVQSKRIANLTTAANFRDIDPGWSPDGTKLIFASNRPGTKEATNNIWIMNANGSGLQNLTPNDEDGWQDIMSRWSPDGRFIAFYRFKDENEGSELWMMNADGGQPELLLELDKGVGDPPMWSPDGNHIAFVSGDDGKSEVVILDWRWEESYTLTDASGSYYDISWAPDSSAVIFMQSKGDSERIIHINIFLDDSIYHADALTPIEVPVWSPVDELP